MNGPFSRRCIAAGVMAAVAAAVPAIAAADPHASPPGQSKQAAADSAPAPSGAATNRCPAYSLSQPFLAWGDGHEYTLFGGETAGNVGGQGWQLSGGAHLTTATLVDGSQGQVLDMPAGSVAVTPPMCVNDSSYPLARAMVSDASGKQGIAVYVAYPGTGVWARPHAAGRIKNTRSGWSTSKPIMLHAGPLRGVHALQLRLVAGRGEYQLYNLYVDPRRGR